MTFGHFYPTVEVDDPFTPRARTLIGVWGSRFTLRHELEEFTREYSVMNA